MAIQDSIDLTQTDAEKKMSFKVRADASPMQKACVCKRMKAAATVDQIRKGIVALQEAKIEARKKAVKFQPKMAKLMRAAVNGHVEKAHKAKVANMGACIASKLKDAKHMPASKCPCTLAKLSNAAEASNASKELKPVNHT